MLKALNRDGKVAAWRSDHKLLAYHHTPAWLDPLSIDQHPTGIDRRMCQRTRLVETRRPP